MSSAKPKSLDRLKDAAKKFQKIHPDITHAQALELEARKNGYPNWKAARKALNEERAAKRPTPSLSQGLLFELAELSGSSPSDLKEREKELPLGEKLLVAKNQTYLASIGVEFAVFEPTKTGLQKSILDATLPVRTLFELENFHHFSFQAQGAKENGLSKSAHFVSTGHIADTKVSLYRPNSKNGDPRMWFSKLATFANAADQIAIVVLDDELYLFNFSRHDLEKERLAVPEGSIAKILSGYLKAKNKTAEKLLALLRSIAKNPIRAASEGDTAVGMAVEAALQIKPNSDRKPDFHGIELKAGRGSKTRSTLFAQVPEWALGTCKSSADILDRYGYLGADKKERRLYCTVSTSKANPQGLKFEYDESNDRLLEKDANRQVVAVWPGAVLRQRLAEKHAETFWIQATSESIDGVEHFHLKSVTHTRRPLESQFLPLIQSGTITMDHLIKRKSGAKSASEKGPLFKINKEDLIHLFPKPKNYSLVDE